MLTCVDFGINSCLPHPLFFVFQDDYDEVDLASLDPAGGKDPLTSHLAGADAFGFGVEPTDFDGDDDEGDPGTGSLCEGAFEQPGGLAVYDSPSGRVPGRGVSQSEKEAAFSELSYEEMCRRYVDKYLSGVETLLQQSGLAARVNEWQVRAKDEIMRQFGVIGTK